jgi:predicted TPR repeat methyltransferase
LRKKEEAEESFNKAISIKPDYFEAIHLLASLTGKTTRSAPRIYVENLFDAYASKFDNSLIDKLGYKTPKLIVDMILGNSQGDSVGAILDLGCGTGLVGAEVKEFCTNLEGIDVSNLMLEEAERKQLYDRLTHGDILDYLSTEDLSYDYFISADVFVYVGDLSEIFRLIKSRNSSGGKLVFSTEHAEEGEFSLEETGRYSHSKAYISKLCDKFGYKLTDFQTVNLRKEKGQFVIGGLYLLDF